MNRRFFFKNAGAAFTGAHLMKVISKSDLVAAKSNPDAGTVSLRVKDNYIFVETGTLSAIINKGLMTSLRSKMTGEEFIENAVDEKMNALSLVYPREEIVAVDESKFGEIQTFQISDVRAEVVFKSWDGDGIVFVTADPETGDLIVEPAAYSSRPGVRACRWNIAGLRTDLELVAPFFQGIKLKLDDSLISNSHWQWPMFWEAGLAIFQSIQGGFWVHTRDNRYRYKSLKVGTSTATHVLGFDSEAYGPIDNNFSGGGLCWRINVFKGDWHVPAKQYRDWLWQAYQVNQEQARRRSWIYDISFAVSWCLTDKTILDALAQKLPPERVLLHIPNWRTDAYDEDYPNYTVSKDAGKFIQKGQQMGFHMMPHCNAVDMDPSNPAYAFLQDFQNRDLESKKILGWSWYKGKGMGVPESNDGRLKHRDKKVMVKVHAGHLVIQI
ncbi:MAG: hypothetical protein JW786_08665 [Desulfobacterales bacterium]|nr:hypothetical protein [Desulfobacterales bacterium]